MKKQLLISSAALLITACSLAQNTRGQVEKALKDPKAAENAAKADAMLIDKKKIKDSTQYGPAPAGTKKQSSCYLKREKKPAKRTQ